MEGRGRGLQDGCPICLVGCTGRTPTGIRIGPVFTPPELRSRGYATALVAEFSRMLLDTGRRFCFLYTDMSNATSNAIYRRIGYRLHCRSAMIRFTCRTRWSRRARDSRASGGSIGGAARGRESPETAWRESKGSE